MHNYEQHCQAAYQLAVERFAQMGVDCQAAMDRLAEISVSLHCWQGDDVAGFEPRRSELGGGLAVTGNYPGRAQNVDQLRSDLDKALSLIPGRHRLNLHASYGEFSGRLIERNEISGRSISRLDRVGERAAARSRFQSHLFRSSTGRLGLDAGSS